MKNVLTIAGSDSSGRAGIQADLKTMCALGVYGMSAITAVTAQNAQGVYALQEIDPAIVDDQIRVVFEDIRVDAVKVGMVSNARIIRTINERLLALGTKNIVVDPVMVSKSGASLLRKDAIPALHELMEIADVATPNIPEAEILAEFSIKTEDDMRRAARIIAAQGVKNVLIKGGRRMENDAGDLLLTGGKFIFLRAGRVGIKNTHGTGCSLSTAIASRLALGDTVEAAARAAKKFITQAIIDSCEVGNGTEPVGHLADLYRRAGMEVL
ncbi:MAG: bifunctional hydroxymethylpyrimidine kinase/phosphomethylpyrimidine kinase [Treponema sp.]|jgi:hydroxymethylpyrimidine/phosphomethylpyrimidine kinase|nr:bifunctional hydroxymethylpyrimidine kinase/phosphomethylpyrimidine kinase [Treponema sp.]